MQDFYTTPFDHLESIRAPNESVGRCRNHARCDQSKSVDLGNGYCVVCWDKGMGSKDEDWAWQPSS